MDLEDTAGGLYDDQEDVAEDLDDIDEEGAADAAEENAEFDPLTFLHKFHPETLLDYAEKILPMIPLLSSPPIDDPNHTSQPFLTLYEKTKIIGFRANQLAQGAVAYITVPGHVRDVTEIARMELEQKRLPFIVKRPMPDGTFEYWRISDMVVL
jgi:DNA-directed RNA polymerase I, II, and III subunit RPABC2